MSNKSKVNRPYSIYSVIIGVSVALIFILDYYAIKAGELGDGIGFLSLVFISPVGIVLGLKALKSKKDRYVSILGIGINLSEFLYLIYLMTHFAP